MQPFEQMLVWQKAHAVAVALHQASTPWREFELRAQEIRRMLHGLTLRIRQRAVLGNAKRAPD